jgi:H+/Cl- antiporter ClcA
MDIQNIPASISPYVNDFQRSWKRMLPYWVGAAITALFSVMYAKTFALCEQIAFGWNDSHPLFAFFLIPLCMIASMLLTQMISPTAAGSGIPQLLAALEVSRQQNPLVDKFLDFKMIVTKFFGSCICVAGGGVIGREGPMLQISAGIFNLIRKYWPKLDEHIAPPSAQSMILAGGAAGLASAFNTPLGGIIFAIEELAKVHISQIRLYVFHAVIIAGLLAQSVLGDYLYIGKITINAPASKEIFPLILATGIIGFLGAASASAIIALLDLRSRLKKPSQYLMTIILGLLVACLCYFFGRQAIGSGRHVIVDLLTAESPASPLLGFVRGFGNLLTYAGGVVGGVFSPALSTGAAFGSWFSSFGEGYNHQVWVLAGMVAFLTGLTRTPFTSVILVLEMTDTHNIIIILMLAGIIAHSTAKLLGPLSFYEQMSHRLIHGKPPDQNMRGHDEES